VPISRLQSDILLVIAAKRDPESFIAGGVPINRSGPRYSSDVDIFHDREERVADAALADAAILKDAGFDVAWLRQQPATYSASIRRGSEETKLEWVADSDYRFFPVVKDEQFGYVLHIVDLAINKTMAAASRRDCARIYTGGADGGDLPQRAVSGRGAAATRSRSAGRSRCRHAEVTLGAQGGRAVRHRHAERQGRPVVSWRRPSGAA